MIDSEYGEWLARGQAHQEAGRAVDAMLCYRRALKVNRYAVQVQFHLGEVLAQLGLRDEAMGSWRMALTWQPQHVPSLVALGDLLRAQLPTEATVYYRRALAVEPGKEAARRGLLMALLAVGDVQAYRDVLPALAGDGGAFDEWQELAHALVSASPSPERSKLLATLQGDETAMAMPLLRALIISDAISLGVTHREHARMFLDNVEALASSIADLEALRRFAVAAATLEGSQLWAQRYAFRCADDYLPAVPVLWPRRSAGVTIRIAYLIAPSRPLVFGAAVVDSSAYLRCVVAAHSRDRFAPAIFIVDGTVLDDVTASSVAGIPIGTIGDPADAALARALGEADYDVLVDLAGMAWNVGPLLATRPARSVWTYAALESAHVSPLVGHTLPTPPAQQSLFAGHVGVVEAAVEAACANQRWFVDRAAFAPDSMRQVWRAAVAAHQAGDTEHAVARYREMLSAQPDFAPAHYLLGLLLRDRGETTLAEAEFRAAVAIAPRYTDARAALANILREDGRVDLAAATSREGLAFTPAAVTLWRALGLAELARHDGECAREAFEKALELAPADAQTHYNDGVALQMLSRRDDALRAYQRALAFDTTNLAAEFNMGVVFHEQLRFDAAIHAFEQVLERDPRHVPAYKALGEALLAARRPNDWLKAFDRFEANCPHAFPLAVQALEACQYRGDFAALDRYLNRLRQDDFTPANETELADGLEQLLFLLLYFDIEADALAGFYKTYDAVVQRVYGAPLALAAQRRPGRVRVGYLSGDLRNHVMGKMMWEALRHHDRDRFELFFFSLSNQSDDVTLRYRDLADHFDVIADLSEQQAAQRIAAADLDILVDLATNTRGAKPGILALKPARVQITHVASAGVLGLSAIDFKLTDAYADLAENQAWQIETLLPMQGCVYPYRHTVPAADHPFDRQRLGIPADAVVMSAFVHPLKLSRRCLSLWREILERLPRAVLAISPLSADMRDVYGRLMTAGGIPLQRILILPQGRDDAENQSRYNLVDFALDTLPYGGVNGTLEALDMGVPVVTLCGRRHGERTSYSILANLGVPQTIALSGSDYVNIAVRLATEGAFAGEVRAAIRAGLAASPLTDMNAYTRHLEHAYTEALGLRYPSALAALEHA